MNRKRRLSGCEDEPLSKRINNLRINNASRCFLHAKQPHPPSLPSPPTEEEEEGSGGCVAAAAAAAPSPDIHSYYKPDLGPADNPLYYETNRLLFQLHLARTHRSHHP